MFFQIEAYNAWKDEAEENSACDASAKICVTVWNESVKAEIEELVKQENVNNFKVFMAPKVNDG